MPVQPVADDLFEVLDGAVVLLGGRCNVRGAVAIPKPVRMRPLHLYGHRRAPVATEDTLWTFTVQSLPRPADVPRELTSPES
jgi:hypothetical protein